MRFLRFLDSVIGRAESWFIIITVSLMIFLSFLQVILRNFFSTGIIGTDEVLRHIVFWTGLIGASLLTRESRHIRIDIFSRLLSGRIEQANAILVNLVSCGINLLLVWAAIGFVGIEMEFKEKSPLLIPVWTLQAVMPFAFGMITFRFFIKTIEKITELLK